MSSMSCFLYPSLSTLEDDSTNWVIPLVDKTTNHKRLKQEHEANYGSNVGANYCSFYTGSDNNRCTSGLTSLSGSHILVHAEILGSRGYGRSLCLRGGSSIVFLGDTNTVLILKARTIVNYYLFTIEIIFPEGYIGLTTF